MIYMESSMQKQANDKVIEKKFSGTFLTPAKVVFLSCDIFSRFP